MVNFQRKQRYGWEDLLTIMHLLRAPEGCPWDREQTHQSIRRNFLEETYEALDAIDRNDTPGMCEELGDVLLQVVFHSVMEEEQGRFTADDVVDGVAQKLVFRHTHVFGAAEAADSAQALEGWEAQKKKEKGFTSPADAVEAVPHTLPALWRAEKIVSRSVKAGFNWDSAAGALDKLNEETAELRQAVESRTACGQSSRHPGGAGRRSVHSLQDRPDVRCGPGGRSAPGLRQIPRSVPPGGGCRRPSAEHLYGSGKNRSLGASQRKLRSSLRKRDKR